MVINRAVTDHCLDQLLTLIREVTPGAGTPLVAATVYDRALSAWLERPEEPTEQAFPGALDWLLHNQRGDGTWGAGIDHHHDRVVSTLAAMVALAKWRELAVGSEAAIQERISAAAWGLAGYFARLRHDLQSTAAFAATVSALLAEIRWRGIPVPGAPATAENAVAIFATLASSTPRPAPEVPLLSEMETAWVVHGFTLLAPATPELLRALACPLDRLEALLKTPLGPAGGSVPVDIEIDVRARAFRALSWAGRQPDPATLLASLELGPEGATSSPLADAHLLEAVRLAPPFAGQQSAERRALGRLSDGCTLARYWVDQRHASPFVATSHALLALPPELTMAKDAIRFLEESQRSDGSWGHFDRSTAEETASCLQALVVQQRGGAVVAPDVIVRATAWLMEQRSRPTEHPPLFVGRVLFCPARVVEASVIAALALAS